MSERWVIRGVVIVASVLGLVIVGLSLLPNHALYQTSYACDPLPCQATRTVVGTQTAARGDLWLIAALLAPGLLVWWKPRPLVAFLWSPIAFALELIVVELTFESWFHRSGYEVHDLWPAASIHVLRLALFGLVLIAVPIGCLVDGIATQVRRHAAALPVARVVQPR